MSGRCEWSPVKDAPASHPSASGDCENLISVIVGHDGEWHLCESCSLLPKFSHYRSRRLVTPIEPQELLSNCQVCGGSQETPHDHLPDSSGLDDGPYLPGQAPRKKSQKKSTQELANIRAKAWQTRRLAALGKTWSDK